MKIRICIAPVYFLWLFSKNIFNFADCIYVVSEEGEYSVESAALDGNVCGVYVYADAKQTIEVTFDSFNVPCETGSLVTVSYSFIVNSIIM